MRQVIIQLVQHLRPGGIETMALDLLSHISTLDTHCETHIVSLEGTAEQALAAWPRLKPYSQKLHFLNKPAGLRPDAVIALSGLLKQLQATAIHTHHIGPLLYGGMAAKLAGLKVHVHTEHDAWHLNARANRRLQRMLIGLLKPTLVADCEAVASVLTRYFPRSQPQVILNGIDTRKFTPVHPDEQCLKKAKFNLPQYGTLIGCAARLETVKGHQFLLEAFSRLHPRFILALAGDGSLREELQASAERLGISNRVYFLGALDDMTSFYQAIDIFCLPSLNEGLPLSPLEAQASGVPVVITDVGGCSSIVCKNSGVLVPPGDAAALESGILSCQHRSSQFTPRKFVLANANLENTARAYFSLLQLGGAS
ncbi:glycosyltransferase [Aliamphritea hakodatensis]|uniref:glycosyltransferase n=1 Tax=Aliamphritea hakodatensis TaxID=2895352 RepID=UPI0022FD56FC|nr:glycosyltransferase [Aliamphritea hakodatensis]